MTIKIKKEESEEKIPRATMKPGDTCETPNKPNEFFLVTDWENEDDDDDDEFPYHFVNLSSGRTLTIAIDEPLSLVDLEVTKI